MPEVLTFSHVHWMADDGVEVFQDFSWSLGTGQKIRLDPGGKGGLTVLIKLAAGRLLPSRGSVELEGIPHGRSGSHHPTLAQGRVGWVPTSGGLLMNLTLLENLALPLRAVFGIRKGDAEGEARRWLERLGWTDRAGQRPHLLDPAQRWLATLARSAAARPAIWLVDRPPSPLSDTEAHLATGMLEEALAPGDSAVVVDPPRGWAQGFTDLHHLSHMQIQPGGAP